MRTCLDSSPLVFVKGCMYIASPSTEPRALLRDNIFFKSALFGTSHLTDSDVATASGLHALFEQFLG
ncbi:hypothetical protein L596_023424 [Steinernema carpocapsae]|uniref:Uncharacterized protein n=1 Tax=Steinernema carpocapsae TaxID=34508 RepID=A0A4U5MDM9_STECR|nr:hypothetical protein L596_023424 [Steinernema carpocapsae]